MIDIFPSFDPLKGLAIAIALLIAIVGHEIMHGVAALYYGDTTAKEQGRLSLNPWVHIDPVGTIIVPLMLVLVHAPFLFGWAKPVPVRMNLVIGQGGYKGAIVVSLAGVAYNFLIASCAAITLFWGVFDGFLSLLLSYIILYNVILGVFNLWPFPPLDGANALTYVALQLRLFIVARFMEKLQPYGMIFLLIVMATPLSELFFYPAWVILKSLGG